MKNTKVILNENKGYYVFHDLSEKYEDVMVQVHPTDIKKTFRSIAEFAITNKLNIVNRNSYLWFRDFDKDLKSINEMEMFDVKRRDIYSFKDFVKTTETCSKGIKNPKTPKKLKEWTHSIKRHELFTHPIYDTTYNTIAKSQKSNTTKPKKKGKSKK